MTPKQRLDAIFCLGQLQGIKLAIECVPNADLKKISDALQDVYDCLHDCLDLEKTEDSE